MTDPGKSNTEIVRASLARRHRAERRFHAYGIAAVSFAVLAVAVLLGDIVAKGHGAFWATYLRLQVTYDPILLGVDVTVPGELERGDFQALIRDAVQRRLGEPVDRTARRQQVALVSGGAAYELMARLRARPALLGTSETLWLVADDDVDTWFKARGGDELTARLGEQQIAWMNALAERGDAELRFNRAFFTSGDSREPEQAGIGGALVGTLLTLIVTLTLSFPLGVAAAIYLEEFAPENRWTDIIEVNINNLAAVPSIIFGLLGLAVFINIFEVPRSAPVLGGLVLSLITLPTIIVASRAAIKAVPPSIREAALGLGASKMQTVLGQVLPLAMPGMLTGAIIGMAHALGETAPLLMIGMVAFIVDVPQGFTEPASVLPVQIFLWADSPERAFVEKTSGAIMVLLAFLVMMNGLAVLLRKRLERRW